MIAIVAYNAGNSLSVKNAVERAGYSCIITDNEQELLAADKVIFPGVGEAGSAMNYLVEKGLHRLIPRLTQPVLGICLGLQLMCRHTEESDVNGLGIFNTAVKKIPLVARVPHTGWNSISVLKPGIGFMDEDAALDYYFVHSYCAAVCEHTVATCEYGTSFSAVLQKDNFTATQFHPEKSGQAGERFLKNFLAQ